MSNGVKPKLTWRDGITIILFLIAALGYLNLNGRIAKQALLEDQVERNTKVLETYNLSVLSYKMEQMDKKLDEIKELVKAL